jgi:hypothetical protein
MDTWIISAHRDWPDRMFFYNEHFLVCCNPAIRPLENLSIFALLSLKADCVINYKLGLAHHIAMNLRLNL